MLSLIDRVARALWKQIYYELFLTAALTFGEHISSDSLKIGPKEADTLFQNAMIAPVVVAFSDNVSGTTTASQSLKLLVTIEEAPEMTTADMASTARAKTIRLMEFAKSHIQQEG